MDRIGIGRQILSPMPELLSYWLPAKDAQQLIRYVNDVIASMTALFPQRFCGLDLAIPVLAAAMDAVVDPAGAATERVLLDAELLKHRHE